MEKEQAVDFDNIIGNIFSGLGATNKVSSMIEETRKLLEDNEIHVTISFNKKKVEGKKEKVKPKKKKIKSKVKKKS